MFCAKCGEKINEGGKFCPSCGAGVGEVHQSDAKVESQPSKPAKGNPPFTRNKLVGFRSGKLLKKIIAVLGLMFMVLVTVAVCMASNSNIDVMLDNIIYKVNLIITCGLFWIPYFILSNIGGIREKIPLYKSTKRALNVIAVIITCAILLTINTGLGTLYSEEYRAIQEEAALIKAEEQRLEEEEQAQLAAELKAEEERLAAEAEAEEERLAAEAKAEEERLAAEQEAAALAEQERLAQEAIAYEAEYKASCSAYAYDTIFRNSSSYIGANAVFTGEVIQVMYNSNTVTMRINTTINAYYSEDTMLAVYEASADESRILEGDVIVIYGDLDGLYTYDSILGAEITIPSIAVKYIENLSA